MALRWAAAGMQFRRVNGHLHLPGLRNALEAEVRKSVGPAMQDEAINAA
jgi:putative transposase